MAFPGHTRSAWELFNQQMKIFKQTLVINGYTNTQFEDELNKFLSWREPRQLHDKTIIKLTSITKITWLFQTKEWKNNSKYSSTQHKCRYWIWWTGLNYLLQESKHGTTRDEK